ncbi:MAG TPA: lipopolysaccharide heptosyltransferase II [Bryobacteraceae bacterium]|nr:lipopolysaccharide heptosyltransferase II [Bryobacteraceae bacterium]
MKVLVRATNWIGDAVMSLPAIRAIHYRFPQAAITVLAKPWVAALYEGERAISEVIPLDAGTLAVARRLRRGRFDLAVLLPNSFHSAIGVWLGGAKRIVGYARDGRGLLLSDAIAIPAKGEIPPHESYYYLELLRRAGLLDALPEIREIRLDDIAGKQQRGAALFESLGVKLPVIGVSPGAAYGSAKRWLPARFAEAARTLADRMKASVAVFGSAAEKPLCEEVARAAGGKNFAGETTLRQFIDLTAACSLFLTNDSGAMHIASACGVPSVTVFGPTSEIGTGPLGPLARIVREPVDCAPCLLRECPIDHRCMTRVTAEHVIAAAQTVLPDKP